MKVHDMIVEERRHMADLFAGLDPEQLSRQSLCEAWTVHEIAAHLASFLRLGQLKIYVCMIAYAGDFAPGNQHLRFEATDTGWTSGHGAPVRGPAQSVVMAMSGRTRGFADLDGDGVELLRQRIGQETTIPLAGRLRKMARTLLRPSDRRSRESEAPRWE
jgi:hypothetical protein